MRAGTRGALCVYVPYVLSASLEFLRAVARERGVPVSCRVLVAWFYCGWGDTLVAARETQRLPALRGSSQRAAAPATLFRPPGRPCRKESQTFGLIPFRILWIATAVGCQSTHARLRSPRLLQGNQPPCLQKPLGAPGTRDCAGQPAPLRLQKLLVLQDCPRLRRATSPLASSKAAHALEHLGQPVPQPSRSPRLLNKKTELPFKACTA